MSTSTDLRTGKWPGQWPDTQEYRRYSGIFFEKPAALAGSASEVEGDDQVCVSLHFGGQDTR